MATIRIPHSSQSRGERSFAQLILRVPRNPRVPMFDGRVYFSTGSTVDLLALRPSDEYPGTPLLLEYAGNDRTGRGHRRSNDIRVLWRLNAAGDGWDEMVRILTQGADWFPHLAPMVRRELARQRAGRQPVTLGEQANLVTARVLALLDLELGYLEDAERAHVMSILHDQFTARMVEAA